MTLLSGVSPLVSISEDVAVAAHRALRRDRGVV